MNSRFLIWVIIGLLLVSSFSVISTQITPPNDKTTQVSIDQLQTALPVANSSRVTVFIPDNTAASDLSSLLQGNNGISIESYGYLTDVLFQPGERTYVMNRLTTLMSMDPGVYFVNSTGSSFTPFNYYSYATPGKEYYTPSDIYSAYSYGGATARGILGNGTTIAVIDAYGDPFINYDVVAFDNYVNLSPVQLTVKYMNNTPNPFNKSWAVETALDVEWAHASAPGAKILLIITQNASTSLEDALSYAIHNRVANIITLSWGQAESIISPSELKSQSALYQDAAENNISVFAASGDLGSSDGEPITTVNYPASDPYVTGVGGTALNYNNGQYTETAWGGISSTGTTFGSGGGYSKFFKEPSWQTIGNKSTGMRGVPDVSAVASTFTEVFIVSDGQAYTVGGTSLATPIWAGIAARIDQSLGRTTGFLNPTLYQIYRSPQYSNSFTDVTSGSNGQYTAATGWDPVTGLGTPLVSNLINAVDNLTRSYGSMAIQNGSYGFRSASAVVNISGQTASSLYLNGSAFYYLSYYSSNQENVKFGITVNATSVDSRLSITGNTLNTTLINHIGSPKSNMQFRLGISYNGSVLTYSINGTNQSRNVFVPFAGQARFALGAEILNPLSNRTVLPRANFSSIQLNTTNGSALHGNLWQQHYSGVDGLSDYSNISLSANGSNVEVYSGNASPDGYLNSSFSDNVTIRYTMTYTNTVTVDLSLSRSVSGVSWYIDGNLSSQSTVLSAGVHNVTAESQGIEVSSTQITVPRLLETNMTLLNQVEYYKPQMQYVLDDLVGNSGALGNFTVYLPAGVNTLKFSAKGYAPITAIVTGGSAGILHMTAISSTVSVFVFQGNSNVSVNGKEIQGERGTYSTSISPVATSITVTSPGFKVYNISAFNPIPGNNYSFSVSLTPDNLTFSMLSGTIRDAIYKFEVQGVLIKAGNYTFGYSGPSGFYQLYVPSGVYSVEYSAPYYNSSTISLNLSSNMAQNISLFPQTINLSNTYQPSIGYYLPIGYFCMYVTWSVKSSQGIESYIVEYSTSANMSGARTIPVSGSNHYVIIFPIGPAANYYVQVIAKLTSGQAVPGEIQDLQGTTTTNLLINAGIYIIIGLYVAIAIRILRRGFAKKRRY